jgi:CheY-like chemotaxis protein
MTNLIGEEYVVVYADDDPDDLELLTEAFEQVTANVRVEAFFDGVSALSYLQNLGPLDSVPCLIILDINMPRLDGKECLRKIRETERLKNVPVALFTTSVCERDKEFAAKHKAGFITKPLSSAQMQMITMELIGHCAEDIRKIISR